MIQIENVSRRGFLKGIVGTGAFVLSARYFPESLLAAGKAGAAEGMGEAALHPNVYLAIATDGTVYIIAHRSEMGSGDRARKAAKQPVPKKEELHLKARKDWRYIGKPRKSYDLKEMCSGRAHYGQDTQMEGMLYASVMHPPVYGSTVKSVDDSAALKVAGVKQTATID